MLKKFYGHTLITSGIFIFVVIGLATALLSHTVIINTLHMPPIAFNFMIGWLSLSLIFIIISFREFVVGFLIGLFSLMIGWRIAGLYSFYTVAYILLGAFILFFANFIYCVTQNLKKPELFLNRLSLGEWQLVFVRLYLGLDFVPHFTEKLFAGVAPHMGDVNAFIQLGVPYADFFVWMAGLCEFGAAIALGLGLLIRLGSFGTVLYLLIATILGHHFSLGFIWAGPGGGWEFATMWTVLILSFGITGFRGFSLDQKIRDLRSH